MKYRVGVRVIAGACLAAVLPLLPLLAVYYPLLFVEVMSYFQALTIPGTEGYHQDTIAHLRTSIVSVGVYAGAIIAVFGYLVMVARPRPVRDLKCWALSAIVAVSHLGLWLPSIDFDSRDKSGMVLFLGIPSAVAILSVLGVLTSWTAAKSPSTA
jgi:hypothetical protein